MKADNQNKAVEWIALNNALLNCLKQKDNHRFSRYDAFMWLVEHIRKGHEVQDENGHCINRQELVSTYCRLSEYWCWTRQTVQKFISELSELNVISHKQDGKHTIFTLNSTTADKVIL